MFKYSAQETGTVEQIHDFDVPPESIITSEKRTIAETNSHSMFFLPRYRGGKICLDLHFAPLWRANVPKFGISHALSLVTALRSCRCGNVGTCWNGVTETCFFLYNLI